MSNTDADNTPTIETVMVGCRYPADRIKLLDAVMVGRGDPYRATTIQYALDRLIEEHFPDAINGVEVAI